MSRGYTPKRRLLVTDHAVDRYIERVEVMGVERARLRITERWEVGPEQLGTRDSGEREWRSQVEDMPPCVFVTKVDRGMTVVVTTLDDSKQMRGDDRVAFEKEAFEAAQRLDGTAITPEAIASEKGGEWVLPAPAITPPAWRLRGALRSVLPYVRDRAMGGDIAACRAMESIPEEVLDEVLGKNRS